MTIRLRKYYFALFVLGVGTLIPGVRLGAVPFSPNQIEVPGAAGQGMHLGGAAWGDYDGDGDLDALVSGRDAANARQIRLYRNTAGVFAVVNVAAAGTGLQDSSVAFGDMDGDADLDIVVSGVDSGGTRRLRIYRNDGANVFTLLTDVDALAAGNNRSDISFGDFDFDGDLDIVFCGQDGGGRRLRVYRNNGNGTFDPAQIELAGGIDRGDVAWGDYDNDGDLDILYCGRTANNVNTGVLRIYPNNGNGTFGTAFDVNGAATGLSLGDVRWGDYNNDGWLDIIASGLDRANTRQFRAYRNNTNGTFTQVEIPGAGLGYGNSAVGFGDANNDGTLDAVVNGNSGGSREIRISTYNAGTGAFTAALYNPESAANLGLQDGGVAYGDYDGDGDLDLLVSGSDNGGGRQVRLYKSSASLTTANTAPSAPATLAARWSFSSSLTGISIASFTWNAGTDSGAGATPGNGLYYDVQISTLASFARLAAPGLLGATPLMGGYHRPPSIFGGGTPIGVMLKSTAPWAPINAHPGLRTDTTYYFRVRTIDAGLRASGVSPTGTLWTGVAPASSTLAAGTGFLPGDITLAWTAPGDDDVRANLTGNYRIQYSSNAATLWNPVTTPAGAWTVTLATTNIVPGTAQSALINVPTNDTYYIVLWSQDDALLWSAVSNTASAVPAVINRSVTIDSGSPYNFGSQTVGTSSVSVSAVAIRNDGNVINTYQLSAATTTFASPWVLGNVAGSDTLAVFGAFHGSRPLAAAFGPEDVVLNTEAASSGTAFSVDGTQTGGGVAVGASRNLWLRLDTPTLSSTEAPQQITVTITASP